MLLRTYLLDALLIDALSVMCTNVVDVNQGMPFAQLCSLFVKSLLDKAHTYAGPELTKFQRSRLGESMTADIRKLGDMVFPAARRPLISSAAKAEADLLGHDLRRETWHSQKAIDGYKVFTYEHLFPVRQIRAALGKSFLHRTSFAAWKVRTRSRMLPTLSGVPSRVRALLSWCRISTGPAQRGLRASLLLAHLPRSTERDLRATKVQPSRQRSTRALAHCVHRGHHVNAFRMGTSIGAAALVLTGCASGHSDDSSEPSPTVTVTVTATATATPSESATPTQSEPIAAAEPNVGDSALTVGQWREGTGLRSRVIEVRPADPGLRPSYLRGTSDGVRITLKVRSCSRKSIAKPNVISAYDYSAQDAAGGLYEVSGSSWGEWPPLPQYPTEYKLGAGNCVEGWILLSAPAGTRPEVISLTDGQGGSVADWEAR